MQAILQAQDSQFTLGADGGISYQEKPGNPLPGVCVARLVKGEDALSPGVALLQEDGPDAEALRERLEGWLVAHIASVLEPLAALKGDARPAGAAGEIALQVYGAMGIVPRAALEDLIVGLDADARRDLRGCKIRLGPVLVFMPALNKPAAVRLRALLWGLFHGKTLPVEAPKDGIVSFEVDPQAIDPGFYQAVGYPVYGRRAVRIDMLDRVISAVYDSAKGGKFRAVHSMAEWLGCGVEALYEVLEAMGHKKAEEPEEGATDDDGKPLLAVFFLKKGKACEERRPKPQAKSKPKPKGKRNQSANRTPKVMSAGIEARPEDSPFAILGQLKKKSSDA